MGRTTASDESVLATSALSSFSESFDELLGDVSGVAYDRQGGRVLWLTSKQSLVMAMDAKTFAVCDLSALLAIWTSYSPGEDIKLVFSNLLEY